MSKLLAEWFWTDRWMGSSAFLLPMEARGLYREMLTQAWRRGAKLPSDHDAIKRAVGATDEEWTKNWPLISGYFRAKNGQIFNPTQARIYKETRALSSARSNAGRRGGLKSQQLKLQAKIQAIVQPAPTPKPGARFNSPSPSPSPEKIFKHGAVAPKELTEAQKAENAEIRAFLATFCELYTKFRHGAKYVVNREKDVPLVRRLLAVHSRARLERLSELLQRTEDEWIAETDRSIGILSNRISWLDSRLAAAEAEAS